MLETTTYYPILKIPIRKIFIMDILEMPTIFLSYVKKEVVPYIESNYRTLNHRTAVGYLSASFIVYAMLNETNLIDNYIAISPNFSFDKERLVADIKQFDYAKIKSK